MDIILTFIYLLYTSAQEAPPSADDIITDSLVEHVCRFEAAGKSQSVYVNKDGSVDVGYCQKHFKKMPKYIMSKRKARRIAKRDLKMWYSAHQKWCVDHLKETGTCGIKKGKKFRGIKNCKRQHSFLGHYNWGYRTLSNEYDKKLDCLIEKGELKRCSKAEYRYWKKQHGKTYHLKEHPLDKEGSGFNW